MHAFIDESKANGYVMAAVLVAPHRLAGARRVMRELRLRGQQRVHFSKEQAARRRSVLAAVCALDVSVRIYDAGGIVDPRAARTACLDLIVRDLAEAGGQRLVIEQDDSLVQADQADLWRATHRLVAAAPFAYEHVPARSEPLLWLADAAVWSWARGGDWRRRVDPIVTAVVQL